MLNNIDSDFEEDNHDEVEQSLDSEIYSSIARIRKPKSLYYELGVVLQHVGEKLFIEENILREYEDLKADYSKLSEEEIKNFGDSAKAFFIEQAQDHLFKTPSEKQNIDRLDYIKLYLHLQHPEKVDLPPDIFNIPSKQDIQNLIEKIEKHDFADTIFAALTKDNLGLPASDSKKLLAFSKLVNRYTKDQLRVSRAQGDEEDLRHISIKLVDQKRPLLFEHLNLFPKSGKASSHIPQYVKSYTEEFVDSSWDKQKITEYIVNRIEGKNIDIDITSADKRIADKLTQWLFISEVSRNKAASFTSRMFLKLYQQHTLADKAKIQEIVDLYPMSMKGALPALRAIYTDFKALKSEFDFHKDSSKSSRDKAKYFLTNQGNLWLRYDKEFGEGNLAQVLGILLPKTTTKRTKEFGYYIKESFGALDQDLEQRVSNIENNYKIVEKGIIQDVGNELSNFKQLIAGKDFDKGNKKNLGDRIKKIEDRFKNNCNIDEVAKKIKHLEGNLPESFANSFIALSTKIAGHSRQFHELNKESILQMRDALSSSKVVQEFYRENQNIKIKSLIMDSAQQIYSETCDFYGIEPQRNIVSSYSQHSDVDMGDKADDERKYNDLPDSDTKKRSAVKQVTSPTEQKQKTGAESNILSSSSPAQVIDEGIAENLTDEVSSLLGQDILQSMSNTGISRPVRAPSNTKSNAYSKFRSSRS